jgi:hypothetical protein
MEKSKRERERPEHASDKGKRPEHPDKVTRPTTDTTHKKGKWSGPKDENDIYKPMGD